MSELRERIKKEIPEADAGAGANLSVKRDTNHPSGREKHGVVKQSLLMLGFTLYFDLALIGISYAQFIGAPLYFFNRDAYYKYMAFTKQQFGLLANTITQWFSPTTVRVSGDKSVAGQLKLTKDGRLETRFPERLIMMANHQIYTDWLYLWWISYTSRMHGQIYIILKESLKYIPIVGPGMMFYGFIFMSRTWAKDKPRMQYRLSKLNSRNPGSTANASQKLDPMWLLIFPEGTNLSENGRNASAKFAAKVGLEDMRHALLPRSTGLQFCLQELRKTVDWVYDCTIAYEGVPRSEYAQDIYTLRSIYFQGRAPRSVNMHWRRFAISSIPTDDLKAFEEWLRERWREKDQLLEQYVQNGRFPPLEDAEDKEFSKTTPGEHGYIETEVKNASVFEFLLIFLPCLAYILIFWGLYKAWRYFF